MKRIIIVLLVVSLILLSGCAKKEQISPQEEAEKTAERFARYWEQRDYESMYDLFIPELQAQRSKGDFAKFFLASEKIENVVVRLDQVRLDNENEAYAYYTVSSSIYDAKAPAMKMENVDGEWKFNAFLMFFTDDCAEECVPRNCKESICSSETWFKCEYIDIDPCACEEDYECSYEKPMCIDGYCQAKECITSSDCKSKITKKDIAQCELKGLEYEMISYCLFYQCNTKCALKRTF